MYKKNYGYLLIGPGMLLIFFILIFPLFYTIYISLYQFNFLSSGKFVGLENYIKLLTNPEIIAMLIRTVYLALSSLMISMVMGFILALLVCGRKGFYAYIIQIIGLVPWVTSMVVSTLLWKWFINGDFSILNYLVGLVGIKPIQAFSSGNSAMMVLILIMAWRTVGYSMVMIIAGLKSISTEIMEAGQVDGASRWQTFWYIKYPLIKTPVIISSIVIFMSNLNNVTVPLTLTGGGPGNATNVVAIELYRQAFQYYSFGSASALSFIITVINVVFVMIYMRKMKYEI